MTPYEVEVHRVTRSERFHCLQRTRTCRPKSPTLVFQHATDGLTVDAYSADKDRTLHDTTGEIAAVSLLGMNHFKVRFQRCGEDSFIVAGNNNQAKGYASCRGTTPSCQIQNWDGNWTIVRTPESDFQHKRNPTQHGCAGCGGAFRQRNAGVRQWSLPPWINRKWNFAGGWISGASALSAL